MQNSIIKHLAHNNLCEFQTKCKVKQCTAGLLAAGLKRVTWQIFILHFTYGRTALSSKHPAYTAPRLPHSGET